MSFTFIGLFCKPKPRGGTAAGAMGLAGSLLPAPLASASQSRWDCSSDCTRCSVAPVPALHCSFPPGRIQLLVADHHPNAYKWGRTWRPVLQGSNRCK